MRSASGVQIGSGVMAECYNAVLSIRESLHFDVVIVGAGPAGADRKFRINPGNCIHCKICEIRDPAQNIR